MRSECLQEACPFWAGDGRVCICVLMDLDPPEAPPEDEEQ